MSRSKRFKRLIRCTCTPCFTKTNLVICWSRERYCEPKCMDITGKAADVVLSRLWKNRKEQISCLAYGSSPPISPKVQASVPVPLPLNLPPSVNFVDLSLPNSSTAPSTPSLSFIRENVCTLQE
uniref:Uncharacterized protein n=1 Tax=Glossina brevipalpis TaxID=37001 RepID=A0A1A9W371_9MUSC